MTGPVGPRGLTILVVIAIAGILLALIGWSQRGAGPPRTGGIPPASSVRAVALLGITTGAIR